MGFRFQKRISLLPWLRLNLSKGGLSTSLGPRGADVNIGRKGVTTNAGIPGTGLSYRSRMGSKGTGLGILAVVAGAGFWAFQHWSKIEKTIAPLTAAKTVAVQAPAAMAPSPTVASSGNMVRFVHRAGSVLRDEPKTSGKTLKKEMKGAAVTLLSEADGWAQVQDGALTGYMRASVLGAGPPK